MEKDFWRRITRDEIIRPSSDVVLLRFFLCGLMECTTFSYHRAKPKFHLPFSGLVLGGRGCLNEILIFSFFT